MNLNSVSLCQCKPTQIVNFNMAFNNVEDIHIYDSCNNEYDIKDLQFSYSIDSSCWSCYMNYDEFLLNTVELRTDFYIRIKVKGDISKIIFNNSQFYDYSTQLDSNFSFAYCGDTTTTSNIYNPYANMDCAIQLYQNLSNTVACITGIPIYYFKLTPDKGSKDITFKEYALMNVESVKQIKLIVQDGQMPSSKPEFADWGLEFNTEWNTEILKSMFATAFGNTAQPMEGDLIYVPMMKRMWMVNESYEEKRDGFMWINTTFKVTLVKYQEKGSVDLADSESLINEFVKNKYEDLFGEDDEDTEGSGQDFTSAPISAQDNLLPIYQSDAQRKYVSCNYIDIKEEATYYHGTVISDKCYSFSNVVENMTKIVYQKKFCGNSGTISFIIKPSIQEKYKGTLLSIGNLKINISQTKLSSIISTNLDNKIKLTLRPNITYFVYLRWSKELNIVELFAAPYSYPTNIPLYKLQPGNYYYDIDNKISISNKWNIEFDINKKSEIILYGFYGSITNIKVFESYDDNISEILQMYPTNNTLIINDTARNILGMDGYQIR